MANSGIYLFIVSWEGVVIVTNNASIGARVIARLVIIFIMFGKSSQAMTDKQKEMFANEDNVSERMDDDDDKEETRDEMAGDVDDAMESSDNDDEEAEEEEVSNDN